MNLSTKETFYSNGKLLLTGEYLVMFGAKALAIPLKYGQSLEVHTSLVKNQLQWRAYTPDGIWFYVNFSFPELEIIESDDEKKAEFLLKILLAAKEIKNDKFNDSEGVSITTKTNFPVEWGIGTSSTLIKNLADWAGIDPFVLFNKVSVGSGYDIACAMSSKPIVYWRDDKNSPNYKMDDFEMSFLDNLWFVYSGKKQSTENNIEHFRNRVEVDSGLIDKISVITRLILKCNDFSDFIKLLEEHERIIGRMLEIPPVQKRLFPDFDGLVKSLGAWGGDFYLVASVKEKEYLEKYFEQFNISIIIPYKNMILRS